MRKATSPVSIANLVTESRMRDTDNTEERKRKENADILDSDVKDAMKKYIAFVRSHMIINHSYVINYKN